MPYYLSRRTLLKLGLVSLLSACTFRQGRLLPMSGSVPGEARPSPIPTSTPHPSANGVAANFLAAWPAGDYAAMYELTSQASRLTWSQEQFRARYDDTLREATVTAVETELRSLLHDGYQSLVGFRTRWHTALFAVLEFDNMLPLLWDNGRWTVAWSPALILPELGDDRQLVLLDEIPARGHIYDGNGQGLAVDGQMVIIGVVPGQLENETDTISQLSAITAVKPEDIRAKIATDQPDWFVPVAHVSPEVSLAYDGFLSSVPGVVRRERPVRVYSRGDLAAHLLGYLGAIPAGSLAGWQARGYRGQELVGRAGVEAWGETSLAGRRGGRLVVLNNRNEETGELAQAEPQPAASVYLTIDAVLQAEAERILGQQPGAIVVVDPNTGFIRAMASYPRFDPNLFAAGLNPEAWHALNTDPDRSLVNRATQGAYPPGSVFKVVSMAAGLEKLGLTAETEFFCSGTWTGLGEGFIKTCWLKTGHGLINLQDGLTQSCDVVFYEVGQMLDQAGPNILPELARAFGLGELTGVAGVEETPGLVPDPAWKLAQQGESWFAGDAVNLAIGQGYLLATPLQIVGLLAAVGNGGTLYRPRLVQRVSNPAGLEQVTETEVVTRLAVSQEHMRVIRQGLEGVVSDPKGTARSAFEGAPFTAAGKTGTAESGQAEPHAWFAGYAPADTPQVAIAVILEHAGEGSKAAAPLFRQVAEAFFARQAQLASPG